MQDVEPSRVYRLFYPQVPLIVASAHKGVVSAMPVVSAISLSSNPPLIGFSSSTSHSTYSTLIASRFFSLSWLDRKYVGAVARLGNHVPKDVNDKLRWAGLGHHIDNELDIPVIDDAIAVLECSLFSTQGIGDHDLIVGEVKSASASDDYKDYWQFKNYHPILYTGSEGGFRTLD